MELGFDLLHNPSKNTEAFKGANCLYDDALFYRLSEFAKSGKIQSLQVDLSDPKAFERVAGAMAEQKLRMSVLDLSNAWWPEYVGGPVEEIYNKLKKRSGRLNDPGFLRELGIGCEMVFHAQSRACLKCQH